MVARPGPARYALALGICYGWSRYCLKKRLAVAYFGSKTP
jgi:hypothetical protein